MALLSLFTEKMTSGDGRVYYGRAVTYAQVASWFRTLHGHAPCERTLRNWIRALERGHQIAVKMARMRQGMKIFVLSPSKHFRDGRGGPSQLSLEYNAPVKMPVQKPVEKLRNSQGDVRQHFAGASGKMLPEKRSTSNKENLTIGAHAPPHPVEKRQTSELQEFYRLRKVLSDMPSGHPRYRELVGLYEKMGERIDGEISQRERLLRREAG